ncbi:MAG: SDR family oxidoreductase [Lysobacterales bacterium]
MTILLTSANGRTGRALLSALHGAGAKVRVFIRDEGQWPTLAKLGADQFAVGDMEDQASIDAALTDCESVIHIGPPMHPAEMEISRRLLEGARKAALNRFIYYSVMHPLLRDIRHHRLKLDVEQALVESSLNFTIIQPSRYMQHLAAIWDQVVTTGIHSMPFCVEQKFSVVDLQDLAAATAIIATGAGHDCASYELAGPEQLSQRDMATIIGRVLNQEVMASTLDLETMASNAKAKGVGEDKVAQMTAMNQHYSNHGFRGNPNILQWLLGRPPATFEAYVRRLASDH